MATEMYLRSPPRSSGRRAVNEGEEPLRPRQVKFEIPAIAGRWWQSDAQAMHTMNVLHLLLPKTEGWFIKTLHSALSELDDAESRSALRGLLGQESVHARVHAEVLAHLERALQFDSRDFTGLLDVLFDRVVAEQPFGIELPKPLRRPWFLYRVAVCAAIEHYTAFFGAWGLDADALDDVDIDPRMLDLLRWHGAEEVEHRGVAFDVAERVGAHWLYRAAALSSVTIWVLWLFFSGTRFMMASDSEVHHGASWRAFFDAQRRGVLPRMSTILGRVPLYLQPGYHPSEIGSIPKALAYLGRSPGVRAAARSGSADPGAQVAAPNARATRSRGRGEASS